MMDDNLFIVLPQIDSPEEPESYVYSSEFKPQRYIRVYKTVSSNDYGKDEEIRAENQPV